MRKKLLSFVGCILVAGGALAFVYYAYLELDLRHVQRAASTALDQKPTRHAEWTHASSVPHAIVIVPPRREELIGRMDIPRASVSVMVLEGADPKTLRVAAGHISGTALPGTAGNVGIAAHRDTFFGPLRYVRPNDAIVLTTSYGTFRYTVDSVEIVSPTEVRVLQRTSHPELTLVTCYPFLYVGSAPKRFVVHARQQL